MTVDSMKRLSILLLVVWAAPMPVVEGLAPFPMFDNQPLTGDY